MLKAKFHHVCQILKSQPKAAKILQRFIENFNKQAIRDTNSFQLSPNPDMYINNLPVGMEKEVQLRVNPSKKYGYSLDKQMDALCQDWNVCTPTFNIH